ncbi:MAG: hypothetical protein WBC06_16180 [Chitinophagaceae bacterium]
MSIFTAKAQKYEEIKNLLLFNKLDQAKTDFDKAFANTKFAAKPEAYILKTAIYAGLAMADANKGNPIADQYRSDADAAFRKYLEMDPTAALINDPVYQNGPINLYSSFYSAGYNDYNLKTWATAYEKCKRAAELSDMLISKKLFQTPMDTNILILAGITAENNGSKEEASKYYTRLGDAKVGGEGFESVYRFLVTYYFGKKDIASFEKFKTLGGELYPKSEFFKFDKIDFAVGLVEGFENKLKSVEEMIANDPNNYKANEILAELIYDTLNSTAEGAVLPANAEELEVKMVNAFNKAAIAKPGNEIPYLFIGDHFINKAVKVNDQREAHSKAMKARTKPGTMASKEDIAKRDQLDKVYGETLDGAREPYTKAAELFAAKQTLDIRDKQQYKKAASYLADIFAYKKIQSKGKPLDIAKYEKEEKKWNDTYDSIKN